MCMAIPMQVIRMEGLMAICQGRAGPEPIDTLLTGPLEPGQWVLCFLGAAREVVDAAQAARVGDALSALQAILAGAGDVAGLIDSHFADLVEREPQLPEHLRPAFSQGNQS
jgi:hydrogenase expression/formation protein HypC